MSSLLNAVPIIPPTGKLSTGNPIGSASHKSDCHTVPGNLFERPLWTLPAAHLHAPASLCLLDLESRGAPTLETRAGKQSSSGDSLPARAANEACAARAAYLRRPNGGLRSLLLLLLFICSIGHLIDRWRESSQLSQRLARRLPSEPLHQHPQYPLGLPMAFSLPEGRLCWRSRQRQGEKQPKASQ